MNNSPTGKSKTPLQFRVFHTLLGFAVFFSLITVPAEAQVIQLCGIPIASEFLWWPVVFFVLQLIYRVYGFAYLRHTAYSVMLFHAIYVLFLKFAIWLPASSFWKMQETYTQVLGRDVMYLLKITVFLWACALLPARLIGITNEKRSQYIFLISLMVFCLLNVIFLNPQANTSEIQLIIPLLIYGFLNIFSRLLRDQIATIEQIERPNNTDIHLFKYQLPQPLGG